MRFLIMARIIRNEWVCSVRFLRAVILSDVG
jgi:hypothetical protein